MLNIYTHAEWVSSLGLKKPRPFHHPSAKAPTRSSCPWLTFSRQDRAVYPICLFNISRNQNLHAFERLLRMKPSRQMV